MVGHAIIGFVIGVCAKLLLNDPAGLVITALIGMMGGWLGGYIGRALGWYREGEPAGFGLSVAGAIVLLVAYRFIP